MCTRVPIGMQRGKQIVVRDLTFYVAFIFIYISITYVEYIVAQNSSPIPMDQADDNYTINEYEEYDGDSDTSVYKLDRDDLDSRVELAGKAQKSFLNGQGEGMLPHLYAYNN